MPRTRRHRTAAALAVLATVSAGSFAVSLLPGATAIATAAPLTPYDGCGPLLAAYRAELVRTATAYGPQWDWGMEDGLMVSSPMATARAGAAEKAVGTSETGTNVQEAGVDEADGVKLLGDVLLVASNGGLRVLRAGPTPTLLATVPLGEQAWGAQLLVDGTRVLALTSTGTFTTHRRLAFARPVGGAADSSQVTATLLDLDDPTKPAVLETSTTDGSLVSARFSDGRVRLVTTSAARPSYGEVPKDGSAEEQRRALLENRRRAASATLDQVLPQTERRTAAGRSIHHGPAVRCEDVSHPAGARGTTTLSVTTLDLQRDLAPTGAVGVHADGALAYMTPTSMYVATPRWNGRIADPAPDVIAPSPGGEVTSTELHAFSLDPASARYRASGSVAGSLLNSYSLSEYDGHLRVATTREVSAPSPQAASSASVVVLGDNGAGTLVETGRLDGLGKGERIYAVRYLGAVATVVTFRQTDPLYTLDLADPTAPKVLGQLKIPGFSNYLHPIGDDTLVGLGQDADLSGRVTGLQLATFDLSDLSHPRRSRTLALGRGWSDAAYDPHAFSYHPERGLLTVPMSDERGRSVLLAAHATPGRLTQLGRLSGPTNGEQFTRAVVIGDQLLAVWPSGVVAATLDTLRTTGSVTFAS